MTNSHDSKSGHSASGTGGNFANNPERACEAGQKGGEHSHGGGKHQESSSGSHPGKSGNFADDKQKASEAGKKGGQHSHGGGSH